jgi:hypothetical protein
VVAFDLDSLNLVIFNRDVLALPDFVSTAFVLGADGLARYIVNELLTQAVAGLLVDVAERNALAGRGGGIERDGTGSTHVHFALVFSAETD